MRIAAITHAFNEPEYLPYWVAHYGHQVGLPNLFVVTHGRTPRDRDIDARVQVIDVPADDFDETRRARFMSQLQHFLLTSYDWVIMADADELIVADPARHADIGDYLDRNRATPTFTTVGLNVVQDCAREAPLDPMRPLFRQRAFVRFAAPFCKPAVTRVPIVWSQGFHDSDAPRHLTDDLFMIHLCGADETIARRRIARRNALTMSADDIRHKRSAHFRSSPDAYLAALFPDAPGLFDGAASEPDFRAELAHVRAHPRPTAFAGPIVRVPARFADSIRPAVARARPAGLFDRLAERLESLRASRKPAPRA
jgi:hypothetical protein